MSDPHGNFERGLVTLQAVLGLGLVAATQWPHAAELFGASPRVDLTLDLAAGVLLLASAAIGMAALVQMRESFRVRPTPRPGARLVRHGIYRALRHPMYSAVVGFCAAVSLHQRTWPVLGFALANLLLYLFKARYEERRLRERYADYDAYRARTWGVVPGWGRARG